MTAACAVRDPVDEAVRRLRAGSLVAFATETVYALGADARSPEAVGCLCAWKGRPAGRAIPVLVSGLDAAEALGARVPPGAQRLAGAFWPGPLTLILPVAAGRFAAGVARADGAVGFRCSPHPVASALARRLETAGAGPVTATSLNQSGQPPACDRAQALRACAQGGPGPWLVDGGPDAGGEAPSSVVDLSGPAPALLREGGVGGAAIEAALAGREVRRA